MSYPGDLDYRALKAHNQQVNLLEARAGEVELHNPGFSLVTAGLLVSTVQLGLASQVGWRFW